MDFAISEAPQDVVLYEGTGAQLRAGQRWCFDQSDIQSFHVFTI
jgi:hypothetical protein